MELLEYAQKVCDKFGVSQNYIEPEKILSMNSCREVNEYLIKVAKFIEDGFVKINDIESESDKVKSEEDRLLEIFSLKESSIIDKYRSEIDELSEEISLNQKNLIKLIVKLENHRNVLNKLESGQTILDRGKIKNIVNHPHWKFSLEESGVSNDGETHFVVFRTRSPIHMRWVDKNINIDKSLYMGFFKLEISLDGEVKIFPDGDNIFVDDYFHPHISAFGVPCLGNGAKFVANAICNFDLYEVCNLMHNFLTNYHDHNPYVKFDKFEKNSFVCEKKAGSYIRFHLMGSELPNHVEKFKVYVSFKPDLQNKYKQIIITIHSLIKNGDGEYFDENGEKITDALVNCNFFPNENPDEFKFNNNVAVEVLRFIGKDNFLKLIEESGDDYISPVIKLAANSINWLQ